MNKSLKLFLKILVCITIIIIALAILILILSHFSPIKSDYCLEDGYCKKGRIIYINKNEIIINQENCLKYGCKWDEKNKMCKIENIGFKVKEIIYD